MATSSNMLLGHDLSTVLQCEKSGVKYFDFNSESEPPEKIVAAHGANLVRLRLWVNPPAGFSDLSSVLEMAKRAENANLKLLLCLHLSDYWADPGKQSTPAAWAGQDFPTLSKTVAAYVTSVIAALQHQGTPPFIVAVGNEISNGILWPTGSLSNTSQFTSLLKSGLAAVQRKGIASMLHINNGQDTSLVTFFMDLMIANTVSFDYLGLSFYPTEGALLSDLQSSLATAAARYNKPIVIAEVDGYWTPLPDGPNTQQASLSALLKVVGAVPRGLGAGVCYWESAWLSPGQAYPGEVNQYWNRALWNDHGMPLPALRCYEPYAKGSVQPMMQSRYHFLEQKHEEL
jgi:arabinogalactan endo-1,4-beta-galactosidase